VLLRVLGQGLERGLLQTQKRLLLQTLLRRLLQVPEQGPLKGHARVQASPLRGCHFQRVSGNERRVKNLQ